MHEVSIMQSALEIAIERAQRMGAHSISALGLRVGELSGVVPDALEFAFEALKQDTPAQSAKLVVETVPLVLYCSPCDREFTPDGYWYECPTCHNRRTEIRQGRELDVTYVELSLERH